jgi:hypothetical protein
MYHYNHRISPSVYSDEVELPKVNLYGNHGVISGEWQQRISSDIFDIDIIISSNYKYYRIVVESQNGTKLIFVFSEHLKNDTKKWLTLYEAIKLKKNDSVDFSSETSHTCILFTCDSDKLSIDASSLNYGKFEKFSECDPTFFSISFLLDEKIEN